MPHQQVGRIPTALSQAGSAFRRGHQRCFRASPPIATVWGNGSIASLSSTTTFVNHAATRRRYWARSMAGWPTINDAKPNAAHRALTALETDGRLEFLITQNVDRLHQRAGSRSVLDLHGRLDRVRCLSCQDLSERQTMQQRLLIHNSAQVLSSGDTRPDGDSETT